MNENNTTIEFVNHASVLIKSNDLSILSDPWYSGPVFNKGWRLIYENEKDYIKKTLSRTNYIYLSHEHPDHFNVPFFNNEENSNLIKKNNIKILFQKTKDGRVYNFLKNKGFNILECQSGKTVSLNKNISIRIDKHDFYDSSILIKCPDISILNLNDSPLRDAKTIEQFKNSLGNVDLLLTQFSYAAWKGAKNDFNLRETSAKEKVKNIKLQTKIFSAKTVIPFASFIYFSNQMNFYMNDRINTPLQVYEELKNQNLNTVIMQPGEIQETNKLKQKDESLIFWEKKFSSLNEFKQDQYLDSKDIHELNIEFANYKSKIFKKNSKFLIWILNKLKFLNIFQDINIFLIDHSKNYNFSFFKGLKETNIDNFHLKMHSESLMFIFKNEFGYDTLTVNGCFETDLKKFNTATKTLAIGSLNGMGINLNLSIFFKMNIILLFLDKLKKFIHKSSHKI